MVRIESVKDEEPVPDRTRTTFACRSSTPLIKTICVNCGDRDYKAMTKDPGWMELFLSSKSFFKWEKKLSHPIRYQVRTKSVDSHHQQSIYTPITGEHTQPRKSGQPPVKTQENVTELFLDPAVMGIKRAAGSQHHPSLYHPPQGYSKSNQTPGVEFIKNFQFVFLGHHRQCSFIEAHMLDKAQQRRHAVYGGH